MKRGRKERVVEKKKKKLDTFFSIDETSWSKEQIAAFSLAPSSLLRFSFSSFS